MILLSSSRKPSNKPFQILRAAGIGGGKLNFSIQFEIWFIINSNSIEILYFRYNNNLYDTKNGNQILAVKRMVDKITGFSIWAFHL